MTFPCRLRVQCRRDQWKASGSHQICKQHEHRAARWPLTSWLSSLTDMLSLYTPQLGHYSLCVLVVSASLCIAFHIDLVISSFCTGSLWIGGVCEHGAYPGIQFRKFVEVLDEQFLNDLYEPTVQCGSFTMIVISLSLSLQMWTSVRSQTEDVREHAATPSAVSTVNAQRAARSDQTAEPARVTNTLCY